MINPKKWHLLHSLLHMSLSLARTFNRAILSLSFSHLTLVASRLPSPHPPPPQPTPQQQTRESKCMFCSTHSFFYLSFVCEHFTPEVVDMLPFRRGGGGGEKNGDGVGWGGFLKSFLCGLKRPRLQINSIIWAPWVEGSKDEKRNGKALFYLQQRFRCKNSLHRSSLI